jgi:hypothetical protein
MRLIVVPGVRCLPQSELDQGLVQILALGLDAEVAVALQVVGEKTHPEFVGEDADAVEERGDLARGEQTAHFSGVGDQDGAADVQVEAR